MASIRVQMAAALVILSVWSVPHVSAQDFLPRSWTEPQDDKRPSRPQKAEPSPDSEQPTRPRIAPVRVDPVRAALAQARAKALADQARAKRDAPLEPGPRGGGWYKVGVPYEIRGQRYEPQPDELYDETGVASWYGEDFHGKKTANGEIYDMNALTAAHKTLPMPSLVMVTNLQNGRQLMLRVNDRGPFHDNRLIDLSAAAAKLLGLEHSGLAKVRVEFVGAATLDGTSKREEAFLKSQPWLAEQKVALSRIVALPEAAKAVAPQPAKPATVVKLAPKPTPDQADPEKPQSVVQLTGNNVPSAAKAPIRPRLKPVVEPWGPAQAFAAGQ